MTDERAAKFEKLVQHTKEAISDLCGMKVEDLERNESFNEMARTMAGMVATIRALEKNDDSELPPPEEFENAPSRPHSKGDHRRITDDAMVAARSVTPNDYGITIILHHIKKDETCTSSNLCSHKSLAMFLRREANSIDKCLAVEFRTHPTRSRAVH